MGVRAAAEAVCRHGEQADGGFVVQGLPHALLGSTERDTPLRSDRQKDEAQIPTVRANPFCCCSLRGLRED